MALNLGHYLSLLYGEQYSEELAARLHDRLRAFTARNPQFQSITRQRITERDTILITYGDMIRQEGVKPLRALGNLLREYLEGIVSTVHILPFYPYSSDDGFSVIDYTSVAPHLGAWSDISDIGADFRLMFDAVLNHVSTSSAWFQSFLNNDPLYEDYFLTIPSGRDISSIFRPRSTPITTQYQSCTGPRSVWTTFGPDQVDLNYRNPELLFEIIDVLLLYVEQGAEFIRLDAVAYLWKDIATPSINLSQTHNIIQIIRASLDKVAPHVSIIAEANLPHKDNTAYLGNGTDEAHLVYNFSLPPLVLSSIYTGQTHTLSHWAQTLKLPSPDATILNILASHDGIGVLPLSGILSGREINQVTQRVERLGGNVSTVSKSDGSQTAYELNINYFDALRDPDIPEETLELTARRFLVAQSIMLAMQGLPAIYFHSLFGSCGNKSDALQSGNHRAVNREKLDRLTLDYDLADTTSLRRRIFYPYLKLIRQRTSGRMAFHPNSMQQILWANESVFSLLRTTYCGTDYIVCLHNVSPEQQDVEIDLNLLPIQVVSHLTDLIDSRSYQTSIGILHLTLSSYQTRWLAPPPSHTRP